jgi:hypothetical protein
MNGQDKLSRSASRKIQQGFASLILGKNVSISQLKKDKFEDFISAEYSYNKNFDGLINELLRCLNDLDERKYITKDTEEIIVHGTNYTFTMSNFKYQCEVDEEDRSTRISYSYDCKYCDMSRTIIGTYSYAHRRGRRGLFEVMYDGAPVSYMKSARSI